MSKIETLDNFLGGKLKIYQLKEGFRAGHDSVLLASAIKAFEGDSCLELGFGTGVVSLCLAKRIPNLDIIGIENDIEMLKISKKNIELNNFKKNIKVFAGDIEGKIENYQFIKRQSFDQIYANPPYFIEENISEPSNKNKKVANIGNKKTFDLWLKKALTFSKSGGTITFINHIQNLPEMIFLFSKKLGDIKVTPIFPKKDEKASRFIISGVRDSKKPLTYNQGLILTNKDGKIPKNIDNLLRNGIGFNH